MSANQDADQNDQHSVGSALDSKNSKDDRVEGSRQKKQIKFYTSATYVNRNVDKLYYNTNEEDQEQLKEQLQIMEDMRVDESAGILKAGKGVPD